MGNYYELIEYIKNEYQERDKMIWNEETPKSVCNVQNEFDIRISRLEDKGYIRAKKYEIISKTDNKSWNILIGPASLLYAANAEKYRARILEDNCVCGIFTLKNAFFKMSTIPTAVIVFGKSNEKIWLTSAITTEDVVALMSDISSYERTVYYTDVLNTKNFMPEYYNGELNEVNDQLDKLDTKELQDIAEIISGKNASPDMLGTVGVPYLRGRNIQGGKITPSDTFVREEVVGEFDKVLLEEGDIILQKQFGYHKFAQVTKEDLPAIASSSLFIIRTFGVPEEYLYSYLTSDTGKSIFEKQLTSIERGATIASIALSDLRRLRVPIFDKETMSDFSRIDTVKVEEIATKFSYINRMMAYASRMQDPAEKYIEKYIMVGLKNAGWDEKDIAVECAISGGTFPNAQADIVLMDEAKPLAALEVKSNMGAITTDWLNKVKDIMAYSDIPITIVTVGNYYEIHITKTGRIVKQNEPPTKELLLSLIHGEEVL